MVNTIPQTSSRDSPHLLYAGRVQEDFFKGLALGARGLGFEHCEYLIGVPVAGRNWHFVMTNTFPKVLQERYRRHGFHEVDPTIEYAKTGVAPLTWSNELFEQASLSALSRELSGVGFNHGWTQPLRDSHGRFGALTLARSKGQVTREELRTKLPMMQWLASVAHAMLFREFLAKHQTECFAELTEREIAFLRLAAEGKTAGEIAAELGVVERTASFHISNAITKLGATNKTHAVTLAMRRGLLD